MVSRSVRQLGGDLELRRLQLGEFRIVADVPRNTPAPRVSSHWTTTVTSLPST